MKEKKVEAIRLSDGTYKPIRQSNLLGLSTDPPPDQYEPSAPLPDLSHPLKDNGTRCKSETGALREVKTGKGRFNLISPLALRRLAAVYEKGGAKYSDRNWEKGVPLSQFVDSAMRHINQWREGYADEDHLAHAAWNLFALMHTIDCINCDELPASLNDVPSYVKDGRL